MYVYKLYSQNRRNGATFQITQNAMYFINFSRLNLMKSDKIMFIVRMVLEYFFFQKIAATYGHAVHITGTAGPLYRFHIYLLKHLK